MGPDDVFAIRQRPDAPLAGMYEDRVVITIGKHKMAASVVPASPAWHVAMLVRLEAWWPVGYTSQYFESVEGLRCGMRTK